MKLTCAPFFVSLNVANLKPMLEGRANVTQHETLAGGHVTSCTLALWSKAL